MRERKVFKTGKERIFMPDLNNKLILICILSLVIGIGIGFYLSGIFQVQKQEITQQEVSVQEIEGNSITMIVPAVDKFGNGTVAELTTTIRPGDGLVLVNINNVIADYDTQLSARLAANVASNFTNISLKNIDVIFSIKTDAEFIGGPSAGAAMAASVIILLENKTLNRNVSITGTILEDGSIGEAGAIIEKARACEKAGLKMLLIPKGSFVDGQYVREKRCSMLNNTEYCEIKYKATEKDLKIKLIEVSNIEEALSYLEK